MTRDYPLVWVFKDAVKDPKYHKGVEREYKWPHGATDTRYLPACGTSVDVCGLELEWGSPPACDPCRRCFPKGDPDNQIRGMDNLRE